MRRGFLFKWLSRFQRDGYPDLGCEWVRSTHSHPKSGMFPAKGGRALFKFKPAK
jgi:hypothetical protein